MMQGRVILKCERNEDFLSHSSKNRKSGDSSCAISLIVCAAGGGMTGSAAEISVQRYKQVMVQVTGNGVDSNRFSGLSELLCKQCAGERSGLWVESR